MCGMSLPSLIDVEVTVETDFVKEVETAVKGAARSLSAEQS